MSALIRVENCGQTWIVEANGSHIEGVTVHETKEACDLAESALELQERLKEALVALKETLDSHEYPDGCSCGCEQCERHRTVFSQGES